MNIKYCFHLILFVLFGLLAKAGQGPDVQLPESGISKYDPDAANAFDAYRKLAKISYSVGLPHNKKNRLRIRFRPASIISIEPAEVQGLLGNAFSLVESSGLGSKTACLLPFYYIFLFRLTPF